LDNNIINESKCVMKNRYFIITIDAEGDNCWGYKAGDVIHTLNATYLPRFQALCDKYKFKPVYLTNYEMLNNEEYVGFIKEVIGSDRGEIGMHLHAWNNPPYYELKGPYDGIPYLIEYPVHIMEEKIKILVETLGETFNTRIISHRAGRWATDNRYFQLLSKYGIQVDCSVTPCLTGKGLHGVTLENGTDYLHAPKTTYMIRDNILEVPMTIRQMRHIGKGSIKHKLKTLILGDAVFMRPAVQSVLQMKRLVKRVEREGCEYIEFMLHSSELMPGGSPYFKTEYDVEKLYADMIELFDYMSKDYRGITLKEYRLQFSKG